MENVKIKLELTIVQVNHIIAALGAHPFAEVKDLIEDIKKQGDAQLSAEPLAEAA